MMIPSVHLNGTSQGALLEEIRTALTAVGQAIGAVQQITVHGRDYYVQGPDAYGKARAEMDARLAALTQVEDDLTSLYGCIEQQRTIRCRS